MLLDEYLKHCVSFKENMTEKKSTEMTDHMLRMCGNNRYIGRVTWEETQTQ